MTNVEIACGARVNRSFGARKAQVARKSRITGKRSSGLPDNLDPWPLHSHFPPPILTMRLSRPLLFVGQFPTYSATSRNFSFVRSGVMYLAVKRTKSKRDPSTYLNRKESIFMDIAMKLQQILLHLYYTPGFSFRISSFKLFAILNFTAVFVARLLTIISYFNIESGTYVLR